jgi:large subunit ribosomal protein L2
MIFKKYKASTPSLRHLKLLKKDKKISLKNNKLKNNILSKKYCGGRNNEGKITSFHKGNGVKHLYRKIDFFRTKINGIIEKIEYDPNRTSFVGRIFDFTKKKHYYILLSNNLQQGDYIQSGKNSLIKEGNSLPLYKIPLGFLIYNLSVKPNFRSTLIRSAGTFGQLIQRDKKYARIKLPSGEQRLILLNNFATLGTVSNINSRYTILGKAGRLKWKNRRPIVRGVAMNPIDHPHGGGEGKTSGGRPSVTPWGKPTKGQFTSKFKKKRFYILVNYKNKKIINN